MRITHDIKSLLRNQISEEKSVKISSHDKDIRNSKFQLQIQKSQAVKTQNELKIMKKTHFSIITLCVAFSAPLHAVVIYTDNFDDNLNTGWDYLDRSDGTALVPTTGGSGTSPSFSETAGMLQQTVANYTFPSGGVGTARPQLGGIALSGSGVVGGEYTISATLDSLENTNNFQDQVIVFGYVDEDNFHYVETLNNNNNDRIDLHSVVNGTRTTLSTIGITFNQNPTDVIVSIDTLAGDVSVSYNGAADTSLVTGATLVAGRNGVGSNNDAYTVDDFVIDQVQIPEPSSLSLLGFAGLAALRRRRS